MLHYHGLPFGGGQISHLAMQSKHAFVSFATGSTHIEMAADICQSFAIDNGAFSLWKSGKKYDVEQYVDFLLRWHRHPALDFYLLPDVIDGGEDANQKIRSKFYALAQYHDGLMDLAVPVWHMDESLDALQAFMVTNKKIALGSAGDYAEIGTDKWWYRMSEAMEVLCDADGRPKCKLHGLRMLDGKITSRLPLSSADSTNVGRNIGIDKAWSGTYSPASKQTRAIVMMERIEQQSSAAIWTDAGYDKPNLELF